MNRYIMVLLVVLSTVSCSEILNETDISDNIVCVFAPTDMVELSNTNVNFNWCEIEGAISYHLQIAQPAFSNATGIVLDTTISNTTFSKELLPEGYQWRVKALNTAFETDYTISSFTLIENTDFTQSSVNLETPIDNLITNQTIQDLSWEVVTDAIEYRVQIWNNGLVYDENTSSNSISHTFSEGNFIWQVRAQTTTQNTLYFSRSILVDTTAPNTPTLVTPADATTETNGTISFTWERNLIDGSIEKDSLYLYNDIGLTNLIFKKEVNNNAYSTDLTADTYYWLMKSFDEAGNESEFSTTFSLTIN